jgi:hypothetical protein
MEPSLTAYNVAQVISWVPAGAAVVVGAPVSVLSGAAFLCKCLTGEFDKKIGTIAAISTAANIAGGAALGATNGLNGFVGLTVLQKAALGAGATGSITVGGALIFTTLFATCLLAKKLRGNNAHAE